MRLDRGLAIVEYSFLVLNLSLSKFGIQMEMLAKLLIKKQHQMQNRNYLDEYDKMDTGLILYKYFERDLRSNIVANKIVLFNVLATQIFMENTNVFFNYDFDCITYLGNGCIHFTVKN